MSEGEEQSRVISDKKVKQNGEVHKKWVEGRISKYEKELTGKLNHSTILIGDSKVRHLENEMVSATNLTCFWRSGAKLDDVALKRHIDRHISQFNEPIVVLLFNTCYLTNFVAGNRKYIDLVNNVDEIANIIVETYRRFKQARLYRKPSSKIIFLECPYYSIVQWNKRKGHPQPDIFENNQEKLEKVINKLNEQLTELNLPFNPPRLAQDMIMKIKKRKNHKQSKLINYSLLLDGIHPAKNISKLWLIRINNYVSSLGNL